MFIFQNLKICDIMILEVIDMNTRMAKYEHEEEIKVPSRVKKHAELYDEINNKEISNFAIKSNATVIGNQEQEIDIEKIKKILDTRYKDAPKRRSIRIEQEDSFDEPAETPTKEYDLNLFLEKAKDEKTESYEEVRSKKLRDTQFDILKNLHIDDESEEENEQTYEKKGPRPEDNDLLNLINTITINESKEKEKHVEKVEDTEDANEDLISSAEENNLDKNINETSSTESLEEIKNEIEKVEKTSKVMTKEGLDNSFYTKTNVFKKKDLTSDDEEDGEKLGIGLKILIGITIVGVLIGLFFFLKSIIKF